MNLRLCVPHGCNYKKKHVPDGMEQKDVYGMTLDEMRESKKDYLSPSDVAHVLQCKPFTINLTVRKYGTGAYPFEVFMSGSWVRIPRLAFIAWCEQAKL